MKPKRSPCLSAKPAILPLVLALSAAWFAASSPRAAAASPVGYEKILQSLQQNYFGMSGIETIAGIRVGSTNHVTATTSGNADKSFRIASQSKMFTSSVLLHMMENEANSLTSNDLDSTFSQIAARQTDANVVAKLKRLIDALPEGAQGYTLREFMNMGTQVPNYMSGIVAGSDKTIWDLMIEANYGTVNGFSGNDFDTHLKLLELARAGFPGEIPEGFAGFYSNTNAIALALFSEALSGKTFDQLIQEHVVAPMGLSSNTYLQTATGNADMIGTEQGVKVENLDPTIPWTSGAMIATMGDLLHFLEKVNTAGYLSAEMTAARKDQDAMNFIPMGGMPITYGLGLMNLDWQLFQQAFLGSLPEGAVEMPDVVSTGHGGSIAGASSFSGWLSSTQYAGLQDIGLAIYANSLNTIDKGGFQTSTPSEALFVQAVEHLYRAARADGAWDKDSATFTQGSTGAYITQKTEKIDGAMSFTSSAPRRIAYLDLTADPKGPPLRITLDPTYSFYSGTSDGGNETALQAYSVALPANVRIEGYGSPKNTGNSFTLLQLSTAGSEPIGGEIAAYGENAIALSARHESGALTLAETSRLFAKGPGSVALEANGTVDIESGGDGLSLFERMSGIAAGVMVEGSGGTGIRATGGVVTVKEGASVAAVSYATAYDSAFQPVDERKYAVYGADVSNDAVLHVGGGITAKAAPGVLAVGAKIDGAKLNVEKGGSITSSGNGVEFGGTGKSTLTLDGGEIRGSQASLSLYPASTPRVDITATDNSLLSGRVELKNVASGSTFELTGSTLDFGAVTGEGALLQFGGTVDADRGNRLLLPLSFAEISLLDAANDSNFAPEVHSFGDAYTFRQDADYTVRYTGFSRGGPNAQNMFPAFAAYAGNLLAAGKADSVSGVAAMSLEPDRLTAESYATQTLAGFSLHASVLEQARALSQAGGDSGWRLGQNARTALFAQSGAPRLRYLKDTGFLTTSALGEAESLHPARMAADTPRQGASVSGFFGGYIHDRRTRDDSHAYSGYKFESDGLLLGASAQWNQEWRFAVFAGATESETDYRHLAAKVKSDGIHVGLTGSYMKPLSPTLTLHLGGQLAVSRIDNDFTRHTAADAPNATRSDYRQHFQGLGVTAMLEQRLADSLAISPFAALDVTRLKQGKIKENGPNALSVASDDATGRALTLGFSVRRDFTPRASSLTLTPALMLGWQHISGGAASQQVSARFSGNAPSFTSHSLKENNDALIGSLSVDLLRLKTKIPLAGRIEYRFKYRNDLREHGLLLGLEARF